MNRAVIAAAAAALILVEETLVITLVRTGRDLELRDHIRRTHHRPGNRRRTS